MLNNETPDAAEPLPNKVGFKRQKHSLNEQRASTECLFKLKETSAGLVTIHSKVIVIDPFSENSIVVTGSSNFGPKASFKNDDNLNIIRDKKTVEEYAVNIMSIYDHYRWCYSKYNKKTKFEGTVQDVNWMKNYSTPEHLKEIDFWLGK